MVQISRNFEVIVAVQPKTELVARAILHIERVRTPLNSLAVRALTDPLQLANLAR